MQQPIVQLDIEFEILDVLERADAILKAGTPAPDIADVLVTLLDCASRAKAAGFPLSERKLTSYVHELSALSEASRTLAAS